MLIHPSHQPLAGRGIALLLAVATCVFLVFWLALPESIGTNVSNYLLWHSLLQGLSIILATQIFTLILSTYKNKLFTPLVALGIIFLGVAVFDFSHTLTQPEIAHLFETDYPSRAGYLLFFARLLSALGMLLIALCPWSQTFNPRHFLRILIPFAIIIGFIHWLIFFHPTALPALFKLKLSTVPLNNVLNFILLGVFALSTLLLFRRLSINQPFDAAGFFVAGALLTLAQAFSITHLQSAELFHLISHIYAITAVYILYRAVFNEIVLRPYTLLQNSQQRIAATLEATPDMILELDGRGRPIEIHNNHTDHPIINKSDYLDKNLDEMLGPESAEIYWQSLQKAKEHGVSRNHIIEAEPPQQGKRWFELSVSFLTGKTQEDERYIVIARDITDRIVETEKLKFLSQAVDQTPSIIFILNKEFRIQFINHTFKEATGYRFDEVKGSYSTMLFSPRTPVDLQKHIRDEIQAGNIWQGEIERITKSGKTYTVDSSFYPILSDDRKVYSYLVIENDITESKRVAAQLQRVSNFDRLTGLPNSDRLILLLNHKLKQSAHIAILWINLDHFKNINEGLGHHVGDLLLKEITDRLANLLRPQDILARPSSDNFVMLLPDAQHSFAATQAQAVLNALTEPLFSAKRAIVLGATIGISTYPWDSTDGPTLLAQAETAMHRMKQNSRGNYCFFKSAMREETAHKLVLSMTLKEALDNDEMYLMYQPQVQLSTGKIIGVEALLRWHSPLLGNIPPTEFIPIAEESGDIIRIGKWVLSESLQQISRWQSENIPIPCVSVNISATQFEQEDFVNTLTQLLDNHGPASEQLEIELTEAVAMKNPKYSSSLMIELKKTGIKIAIDDFGTGYSSLGLLKQFRIDTLKIDRSFIRDICHNKGDQAVVNAIISMAHDLGMKTIAEGVETKEQLLYLIKINCYAAQGFYFTSPLPADDLQALITEKNKDGRFTLPRPTH